MKVAIDVKDRQEAAALKAAMEDDVAKATMLVIGTLMRLPTDRSRARVFAFAKDHLDEQAQILRQAGAETPQ